MIPLLINQSNIRFEIQPPGMSAGVQEGFSVPAPLVTPLITKQYIAKYEI
jgi:hypothetical protein